MEFIKVPLKVSCAHCQEIIDAMLDHYYNPGYEKYRPLLDSPAFEEERIKEMFGHKRSKKLSGIDVPKRARLSYSSVVEHIAEMKRNGYLEEVYNSESGITLLAINESRILIDYIRHIHHVPEEMFNWQSQVVWDFITSVKGWRAYLKRRCNVCGKEVPPVLKVEKGIVTVKGQYALKENGNLIWKCGKHFQESKKLVHMKKIEEYFK